MSQRLTIPEVNARLVSKRLRLHPDAIYEGAQSRVKFQCLEDKNHVFEARASNVLHGSIDCPMCTREKSRRRAERVTLVGLSVQIRELRKMIEEQHQWRDKTLEQPLRELAEYIKNKGEKQ